MVGALLGEFIAAKAGLGLYIINAQGAFNVNGVWTGVVMICVLIAVVTALIGVPFFVSVNLSARQLGHPTLVDDVGRVINPKLLYGQIHGGVAQGLGQVLMEDIRYDAVDKKDTAIQNLIDEAVAPLVKENRGVYFEVEGHTDGTGDPA